MIWFLLLFLFWIESSSLTYHTNCTNMTNITAEDYCTNVTCTDTLCSNNTCVYGYYNNTQDCVICSTLRNQYNAERCCDRYSVTSSPFSELIIDSIYVNDTGTVLIRYTPPRDICHHLWTEWGKCPEICDNILPGGYCTMNIDCKDTNECKDFCCYIRDEHCLSCANETGYCAQCKEGLGSMQRVIIPVRSVHRIHYYTTTPAIYLPTVRPVNTSSQMRPILPIEFVRRYQKDILPMKQTH